MKEPSLASSNLGSGLDTDHEIDWFVWNDQKRFEVVRCGSFAKYKIRPTSKKRPLNSISVLSLSLSSPLFWMFKI
ncbi:hypothetical protein CsSME_00043518 [Camellia sinensis var. sinensis]